MVTRFKVTAKWGYHIGVDCNLEANSARDSFESWTTLRKSCALLPDDYAMLVFPKEIYSNRGFRLTTHPYALRVSISFPQTEDI